jgi:hypothetical protein
MQYFVGLDIAMITTALCIVNEKGKIICESTISTNPQTIDEYLKSKKFVTVQTPPPSSRVFEKRKVR